MSELTDRLRTDELFEWMTEPCNCGNVYSHPDGGDAICLYCGGAERLRKKVTEAADRIEALEEQYERILGTVSAQAMDEGLWFNAETAPEAYLQQELRHLHRVVEEVSENGQLPEKEQRRQCKGRTGRQSAYSGQERPRCKHYALPDSDYCRLHRDPYDR